MTDDGVGIFDATDKYMPDITQDDAKARLDLHCLAVQEPGRTRNVGNSLSWDIDRPSLRSMMVVGSPGRLRGIRSVGRKSTARYM